MGRGHVAPGGAELVETLSPDLSVTKISVGPMDNNAYLLTPESGPSVLIDAAEDPDRLLQMIGSRTVELIITTHRHADHWQGLAAVATATGARLIAGRPDADAIARGAGVAAVAGVWDGDTIPVGDQMLEVIGLVGHTPGSITLAYHAPDGVVHLFTGDSLFPGGPGKTSSSDTFESLMNDLESKIFSVFADSTVVRPGHGDDTTLGDERPDLSQWRARGW